MPQTSAERLEVVFPRGRQHKTAGKYRLDSNNLTYQSILKTFESYMNDLEASKDFIFSNIDQVPSKIFLRAITAQKLSVQSRNNLVAMNHLKDVREKYIIAQDQAFFPLNIEIIKAQTRFVSYRTVCMLLCLFESVLCICMRSTFSKCV